MLLHKARDRRGDMHLAKQHGRRDAQVARRLAGFRRQRRFRVIERRQQLPAALQMPPAFFGQRNAARGAVEQAHTQVRFKSGQRAHHGR